MAFKMKGFNPGKGTGMNSAFKSKAVEWVKDKAEDFADKISNIDLSLNLKSSGKSRGGGKGKSSIGGTGEGGGKSSTTSKKSPIRVDMPDVNLSPGSESRLHPLSFRPGSKDESGTKNKVKRTPRRKPADWESDDTPDYKGRRYTDISQIPGSRKRYKYESHVPFDDTGIHTDDTQPKGATHVQRIAGNEKVRDRAARQTRRSTVTSDLRSPSLKDFYAPQQGVLKRGSDEIGDWDDNQWHNIGDKLNETTLKYDPKDHLMNIRNNEGWSSAQYKRTGAHKDKYKTVYPTEHFPLKRGKLGHLPLNIAAGAATGGLLGGAELWGYKRRNLRGPVGKQSGKIKYAAQTTPLVDPTFGDPDDYYDNPIERYKEKWKKGQLKKMTKKRHAPNILGGDDGAGGFQINPRKTYRDVSKIKKDGEHRKVSHPSYRDEHGIKMPYQKEYFVDGIKVKRNIFGGPKRQKKQLVLNDPNYWPEEQRKTFFGVPIKDSKKRKYKIDPKTNQPKKKYLKKDPDFDYQVSEDMPRTDNLDTFVEQAPKYSKPKIYGDGPADDNWNKLTAPEKKEIDKDRLYKEEGYIKSDKLGANEDGYLYAPGRAKIKKKVEQIKKKKTEKKKRRKEKRATKKEERKTKKQNRKDKKKKKK